MDWRRKERKKEEEEGCEGVDRPAPETTLLLGSASSWLIPF